MSSIIVILFLGGWLAPFSYLNGSIIFAIKLLIIMFFFVWIRATLPRYRYDHLMYIGWKVILPLSLGFSIFSLFLFLCLI
jgi:NADH-quinone oxidoreductase subunit H